MPSLNDSVPADTILLDIFIGFNIGVDYTNLSYRTMENGGDSVNSYFLDSY